ncbi:MAG: Rossmann-like and DUF2520 domain-containing protein [Flavobacteriales bacterium]
MNFSLIGTGNAAWHFARMLRQHGHSLLQICARNQDSAREFDAEIIANPGDFSKENDLIILAVKDDVISELSKLVPIKIPAIHVSGATSIEELIQQKKGVVWPVQTIKKYEETDHSRTPFLIEASDEEMKNLLMHVFQQISTTVYYATGEQRAQAHMATVFANNFTTQLLSISEEILKEQQLPLDVVLPSLREIIHKLETKKPLEIQTGPARRADMATIQKQIAFLQDKPEFQEIYTQFTNRILRIYHGHEL